ncbi:MAG: primosomal protein N' [Erysipelotrichaceae bacterium]|nr:primosomal protein N' [Erysipelotrichaceae bacterium]
MYILECWIEHPVMKLDRPFSYLSEEEVERGCRVAIDFNHQQIIGFVENCFYSEENQEEIEARLGMKLKFIQQVIDQHSLITHELHDLALWMAQETLSPVIACFQTLLPSKIKPASGERKIVMERFIRPVDSEVSLTPKQAIAYEALCEKGEYKYSEFLKEYKSVVKTLITKGVAECFEKEKAFVLQPLENEGTMQTLTVLQQQVYETILTCPQQVVVLHGVTGSGKTEVYLHLAKKTIKEGRQVLFLVPEISLTPQMVQRVKSRFGSEVAIYHSGLNAQEKYEQYQLVKQHQVSVVVGTRSAIFMPFDELGLIIMDEEHDTSYKQDKSPSYHCRDIAIHRAQHFNCKVVLGSATPSLETYARAIKQVYGLAEMKERINHQLPKVEVVDMREVLKKNKNVILSDKLKEEIDSCLNQGKQAILLLNRRGFHSQLVCKKCLEPLTCPHCETTMTYHAAERVMKCHLCDTTLRVPSVCPECKSSEGFNGLGFGTQRLEQELTLCYPEAKILRMDADTTSKKSAHEKLLTSFGNKEADILVGTQMIAKGLDYPDVTLVGVLNADAGLSRSDYRSSELTFDLITQASGRSGRSDKEGKVVLQVMDVEDYAVQAAIHQDYREFFVKEMNYRRVAKYPPYYYLIEIVVRNRDKDAAKGCAERIKEGLQGDFVLVGPGELMKQADFYRYRILMKGKDLKAMKEAARAVVELKKKEKSSISIDIEPMVLE